MSFLSNLFSTQKEEIKPQLVETPEQSQLSKLLSGYASKYGTDLSSPYAAYPGQLSAATPSTYAQIDPLLQKYMGAEPSRLSTLASGELEKTLIGEYDPYTSPFYQSTREGMLKEAEEEKQRIKQEAQKVGMFSSEGRLMEEADIGGLTTGRLGQVLAGLAETERGRRFEAVPYAQQYGAYQEEVPIRQLSAIAGYGGIPAGYEQADLDRLYQEFQRQKAGEQVPLEVAQSYLSSYQPTMAYPTYETTPSYLSQFLGYGKDVASIIGSLINPSSGSASAAAQTPTVSGGGYAGAGNQLNSRLSSYMQKYPWLMN